MEQESSIGYTIASLIYVEKPNQSVGIELDCIAKIGFELLTSHSFTKLNCQNEGF